MEYVKGKTMYEWILDAKSESISKVVERITTEIKALHSLNYVHGDLRSNNIIIGEQITNELQFWIIDFDWAGIVYHTHYPLFMNHKDINWPVGAEDGKIITFEHDLIMAKRLLNK